MTDLDRAVLDAADKWLRAIEAIVGEDERRDWVRDDGGVPLTERARDQAEFDLTVAVQQWRKGRRPASAEQV